MQITSVTIVALAVSATLHIFPQPALAQQPEPLWKSQWITSPLAPQKDAAVLHFRKSIELPAIPQHFYVDVSADHQFLLHVNGQRVGSGPARSDLAHWRYETYDLAPYLHSGNNVLAATVWNFGTAAAVAQMSNRTALLVHGHSPAEEIADTDQSWLVEQEAAVVTLPTHLHGYFAADPGIRIDAASYDWQWDAAAPQRAWSKPLSLHRGSLRGESDAPNAWQLVPDPLPAMEMKLVPAGKVVRATGIPAPAAFPEQAFTVPAGTKASVLIDNSSLTTAYPSLTASGGPGSIIHLTYAEALYDSTGQKGNRDRIDGRHIEGMVDEFIPALASHEFTPLAWRTWRYLQIDIETAEDPVTVSGLKVWFTAYPFTERASFSSDDSSLQKIWEVGWRTARLDAHDTYMDTPYWERLQYIGDTRIQALISYTVAGDDRLARQAIQAFNDSRIPDGLTQSRYPSSLVQMIPTFSLLWVGMVYDFWMYRGDADFARAQLSGTRDVLEWFHNHQRRDGLMGKLPWWPFIDWGRDFEGGVPPQDADGRSSIITLQYIEALRHAAALESALGDAELAKRYSADADRAGNAVRTLCWNSDYGLIADTPLRRHYSEHANILAVWLDVIPANTQRAVIEKIRSGESPFRFSGHLPRMTAATYYFRFYLARALAHAGMGDKYLELLEPWRQMLSLGLSTWAESPEPSRSDSHAWSSHPNYDFLTTVAGIRPGSPGFQTITVEPNLGSLNDVAAAMPTPRGMIAVKYHRDTSTTAELTLPKATTGHLLWKGTTTDLHEGKQTLSLK
ncbi:MAG TPA: alpha-L-rhamnosidase C-terminal domain-containing protein [Candidatus Solibacter sp.]|nr:alpha-L-rhamnosidase C-terminal domain-containing protein [Candidatus Solibacter sp.]